MKFDISTEFINKIAHDAVERKLEQDKRRRERPVTYEEIVKAAEALAPGASLELADIIQRFLRSKGAI